MWGNWLGWLLSAISVAAVVLFIHWMNAVADHVAPRTAISSDSLIGATIELPISPLSVFPDMRDRTDAGPIYRRAIEQYQQAPMTYDAFARVGKEADIEKVPAINILLEATHCSWAHLFSPNPAEIINYANEEPPLDALRTLGICARRAGQLTEPDNPAQAMKLYHASFSLGAKLYLEHLTWAELDAGLALLAQNAKMIAAGSDQSANAARQFDAARIEYVKKLLPIQEMISSADEQMIDEHAGDVAYIARFAHDPMWRVESILKLGRLRFNAARPGDQRTAMRIIQLLVNDPDPAVRAAAVAAHNLTIERYRMLR